MLGFVFDWSVNPDIVRPVNVPRCHAATFSRFGTGQALHAYHVGDDFWKRVERRINNRVVDDRYA